MMESTINNDLYRRYGQKVMDGYAAIRDQHKILLDIQAKKNQRNDGAAATKESLIAAMVGQQVPEDAAKFLVSIIYK